MSYTVNTLRNMTRSCEQMRDRVKAIVFKPEDRKVLDLTFGPGMAADLVGRTPEALAKAEKEGRLAPPKQLGNGRRFYTLEDLTQIREALGIHAGKAPDEDAVIIAIQNFKGGVGKSTITKHFADFLALHGYSVLVIDCDPQASTTTMFDIQPESLLDDEQTLGNFLSPRSTFDEFPLAIRDTAWPTIKIVPSSLGLQDAEWDLTATLRDGGQEHADGDCPGAGERSRQFAPGLRQKFAQPGKREQAVLLRCKGTSHHSHHQRQMLNNARSIRNADMQGFAQYRFQQRETNQRAQHQRDRRVLIFHLRYSRSRRCTSSKMSAGTRSPRILG